MSAATSPKSGGASRPPSLYDNQPFLRKMLFSWPWPLLKLGRTKTLQEEDLPALCNDDTSEFNLEFMEKFCKECTDDNTGEMKLHRALLWNFIKSVWWIQPQFAMESGCKIGQAIALGKLIDTFSQTDPTVNPRDGYIWAGVLVACGAIILQTHHHIYFYAWRRGMQYRVAAVAAIYAKSLRLRSNVAGGDPNSTISTGMVMNLASNDVERFIMWSLFVSYLFWGPLEAIVVLVVGLNILGPAFAAGYVLLALVIPIQFYLSKKFAKYRSKIAALTDRRVNLVSQAVSGVRVMKMSGWETSFEERIAALRRIEMKEIQRAQRLKATNEAIFFVCNVVISTVIFIIHTSTGGEFSSGVVFSTISLMSLIQFTMGKFFPFAVMSVSELSVSLRRISTFLSTKELESNNNSASKDDDSNLRAANNHSSIDIEKNAIHLKDVTCYWNEDCEATDCESYEGTENSIEQGQSATAVALRNIDLELARSELCCIIGPVGCGKSALLLAIAGELPSTKGEIKRHYSTLAYASQDVWIMNGTIRENIVMDHDFDQVWYDKVVSACGLDVDFTQFNNNDSTIVGDRGIQCSGGQRARIGLARALYTDADVLLLDDPLSAVDTKVGRLIFSAAIQDLRLQRGKGVVLVTHQHQFLGDSRCILMSNGRIECDGTYEECIEASGGNLTAAIQHGGSKSDKEENVDEVKESVDAKETEATKDYEDDNEQTDFKETSATGIVKLTTFQGYGKAMGGLPIILLLFFLFSSSQFSSLFTIVMIGEWAEDANPDSISNYGFILGLCSMTVVLAVTMALLSLFFMLKASQNLHDDMTHSVLRAKIEFFDTNPMGRILNRFSADVGINDDMLPTTLYDFLVTFFMVLGGIATAIVVLPFTLVSVPPLTVYFVRLRNTFLSATREIKRLEGVARSPIFAMLSESFSGISTIRPNNSVGFFQSKFKELHDGHTRAFFGFIAASRWLGFRLDLIMLIFLTVSCFLAVGMNTEGWFEIDPAVLGLALMMLIQLSGTFQWCIRQSAEVVNNMVSSERIIAFSNLSPEAPLSMNIDVGYDSWPRNGSIEFDDVTVRYRDNLPPSLNGISFCINGGERVGVVGRTGSGKSTLIQALFRLLEAEGGVVRVDGVDISTLGLLKVRTGMSVIPQSPVLFSGCSVKENLDPFGKYDDDAVMNALKDVQMMEVIRELPNELDSVISEGGSNFSVGQRQLLCLARAILRKSKVLVLDEPTANVDTRTDQLLQEAVAKTFQGSTILAVAHRLDTIIEYDRILVLGDGKVLEFGTPLELLKIKNGHFSSLVNDTGDTMAAQLREKANKR